MSVSGVRKTLKSFVSPEKALVYPRFFKTGKGEYGEGDKFIGVTVPYCRQVASEFKFLNFQELETLLLSPIHEERWIALKILTERFKRADSMAQKEIYRFYLKNRKGVNNWDLVDSSADKIVGAYLYKNPRCVSTLKGKHFKGCELLEKLAESQDLWERRIAIISTFYFIRMNDFSLTLEISQKLLKNEHDLIHKAVGWLLREIGKKDLETEENFLKTNYAALSRTTLRYAIEKFPEEKRMKYLRGDF